MTGLTTGFAAHHSRRHMKLSRRSPMILLPVDGSLIDGPQGHLHDPADLFSPAVREGIDGVIGYSGLFQTYGSLLLDVPQILNLTASTVHAAHTRKKLIGTIEHALALGVDGVAVHVNVTDEYEGEMIENVARIVESAYRFRMPVMAIAYPRQRLGSEDYEHHDLRRDNPQAYTELVAHVVRIMSDLGVDLIKTRYTGDTDSFSYVVSAAMGVPVVVAGGSPVDEDAAIGNACAAVAAGAIGIAYGRQIYTAPDPGDFVQRLRSRLDQKAARADRDLVGAERR